MTAALIEEAADALWRLSPVGRLIENPLSDLDADQQDEYRQMAKAVLAVVVLRVRAEERERALADVTTAIKARFIEKPRTSGDAALNMGMDYALAAVEQLAVLVSQETPCRAGGDRR